MVTKWSPDALEVIVVTDWKWQWKWKISFQKFYLTPPYETTVDSAKTAYLPPSSSFSFLPLSPLLPLPSAVQVPVEREPKWIEIEQLNTPTNDFPPRSRQLYMWSCHRVSLSFCWSYHGSSISWWNTELEANIKQPNYAVWVYFLSYICTSFGHFHKKAVV